MLARRKSTPPPRNAETIALAPGIEFIALATPPMPEQVADAAARCSDVDLLINNAGIAVIIPILAAPTVDEARLEMETNYFGTLSMCRAFRASARAQRRRCRWSTSSRSVSWFSVPMPRASALRLESRRMVADQIGALRAARARHVGDRRPCRLHRYRHDGRRQRHEIAARGYRRRHHQRHRKR